MIVADVVQVMRIMRLMYEGDEADVVRDQVVISGLYANIDSTAIM
jgi:hypothetical protein